MVVTVPDEGVDYDTLTKVIEAESVPGRLETEFLYRCRRRRAVFVGGTQNGKQVPSFSTRWIPMRIKRGRWEVYERESAANDSRAFFRGYATSKQKAKCGAIAEKVGSRKP